MSDGADTMQAWIDGLRALSRNARVQIAREAAPLIEEAAQKTAKAGTDPDGVPWAETKKGNRAMVNAAEHVTARAAGETIRVKLTGPDVFHHFAARGEARRQVIPEGTQVPASYGAALQTAYGRVFQRAMGAT